MGRPKNFSREDVLKKALPVFWRRGFADTSVQDLEKATGVNKSGLYSEFKDKNDIFVESLRFYYAGSEARARLTREPLGFDNIENYLLHLVQASSAEQKGCFGVNCLRELDVLPGGARDILAEKRQQLKRLYVQNVAAERTKTEPDAVVELLLTFFSGLCIEQNLKPQKSAMVSKIGAFMAVLRKM